MFNEFHLIKSIFLNNKTTHYALDLLLIQLGNGIYLFYPVSWMGFNLNLAPNDDYQITIAALLVAALDTSYHYGSKKRISITGVIDIFIFYKLLLL